MIISKAVARKTLRKLGRPCKSVVGELHHAALRAFVPDAYLRKRLSFCTTEMNRLEHLQQTLIKNIEDTSKFANCEFVLVNYSCPDPRTDHWITTELDEYISSGRLRYFYYPDAEYYSMSHSRNLAFRLARGDIICNVDADNYLGIGFAEYVAATMRKGDSFLQGPSDGRGLSGRLCIQRQHFYRVGGYDETFSGWGYEDADLANRLKMLGVKRKEIYPPKLLRSIRHRRDIRVAQYREGEKVPRDTRRLNKERGDQSLVSGTINPNDNRFGVGRIRDSDGNWLELKPI